MFRQPGLRLASFSRYGRLPWRRLQSTKSSSKASRLDRLNARLPRFLHRYTTPLFHAPVSHITAFLILHELTAVVPLFGLTALFHYTNWLPPYFSEGAWIKEGIERFGRYARRKGWVPQEDEAKLEADVRQSSNNSQDGSSNGPGKPWAKYWIWGEEPVKMIIEVATAWAIVKVFLIPRIILSVWATPWFSRIAIVPVTRPFMRLFEGKSPAKASRHMPPKP